MEKTIGYQNCLGKETLTTHREILSNYKENIQKVINLDSSFPIFFDTNVLLRTYSISFKAREKLTKFFTENKSNLHITNFVQTEFIKNRENVINTFFDNVTNKIPNDFKSEVISKIKFYLEKNKIVFKDYELFEKELNSIRDKCENLLNDLVTEVEKQEKENSNLIFDDKQLVILSETNCIEPLGKEEIVSCKKDFDELSKGIEPDKIDALLKKPGKVFPGVADIKEKPENPYGDFIIFYELMKFSKENKKDIVFLTYDTTKGDWMRKDKRPHLHYIENFYLNTGQMIYILDAERVFEELLDISFKSLIKIENIQEMIPLSQESIEDLLSNRFAQHACDSKKGLLTEVYHELKKNGYATLNQVVHDLDRAEDAFNELIIENEKSKNRYTRIGNLRVRLYISNQEYMTIDSDTNKYRVVNKDEYKPFLHLVN